MRNMPVTLNASCTSSMIIVNGTLLHKDDDDVHINPNICLAGGRKILVRNF